MRYFVGRLFMVIDQVNDLTMLRRQSNFWKYVRSSTQRCPPGSSMTGGHPGPCSSMDVASREGCPSGDVTGGLGTHPRTAITHAPRGCSATGDGLPPRRVVPPRLTLTPSKPRPQEISLISNGLPVHGKSNRGREIAI